jgi:pimeloyl-ACP methyl ester carboxylesterase
LPAVPLVVIAATNHGATPACEALWRDIQQRSVARSPTGRLVVESGHFVQKDQPEAVIDAVLSVAAERGRISVPARIDHRRGIASLV